MIRTDGEQCQLKRGGYYEEDSRNGTRLGRRYYARPDRQGGGSVWVLAPSASNVASQIEEGFKQATAQNKATSVGVDNRLAACPCHSRLKRRRARRARQGHRRWDSSFALSD
jgi:hypothetical protein